MEDFVDYFESLALWWKAAWIAVCISGNVIIETVRPWFRWGAAEGEERRKNLRTNLFFLGTTMAINAGVGVFTAGVFVWVETAGIGFLNVLDMGPGLGLFVSILLFDLVGQYTAHYCLHQWRVLWPLHMVHHTDRHVTAATGTRHHPLDFLVREAFALVAVVLIGAPIAYYTLYRFLTIFFTYMTHANVQWPRPLERVVGWVFVTPRMHKFHHHNEVPWTDSNYGNMLSVWDRIFGTYVDGDESEIVLGLDVADDDKSSELTYQIGLPFNRKVHNGHRKGVDVNR